MMIEFFLGFIAIVFAFAGVALIASTKGGKPSGEKKVNIQEAVGYANAIKDKMNNLSKVGNPDQFDQYLEKTLSSTKDIKGKLKEASVYLMEKEKQLANYVNRKSATFSHKYLQPISQLREKLVTPLRELEVLEGIDQLEDGGYIDKGQQKKLVSEAIDVYRTEYAVNGRRAKLYEALSAAKAGLLRKK